MAPKKIGRAVLVRIPEEDLAQIDTRRAQSGLSQAETIRRMIRWALAQPQKKSGSTP